MVLRVRRTRSRRRCSQEAFFDVGSMTGSPAIPIGFGFGRSAGLPFARRAASSAVMTGRAPALPRFLPRRSRAAGASASPTARANTSSPTAPMPGSLTDTAARARIPAVSTAAVRSSPGAPATGRPSGSDTIAEPDNRSGGVTPESDTRGSVRDRFGAMDGTGPHLLLFQRGPKPAQ